MTDSPWPEHPSDNVAWSVQQLRKQRGWSAARLAEECARAGYPQISGEVIGNIERGRRDQEGRRRRHVTVEELVAFAHVLDVLPDQLISGVEMITSNRELLQAAQGAGAIFQSVGDGRFIVMRPPPAPPEQEGT